MIHIYLDSMVSNPDDIIRALEKKTFEIVPFTQILNEIPFNLMHDNSHIPLCIHELKYANQKERILITRDYSPYKTIAKDASVCSRYCKKQRETCQEKCWKLPYGILALPFINFPTFGIEIQKTISAVELLPKLQPQILSNRIVMMQPNGIIGYDLYIIHES